jgi:hypothetical protein
LQSQNIPWASIIRYVFKIIEKSHDNIVYITYHILHACRHDILIKYKTYFHFIKVRRFKALYYFILDAGRNLQRKRIVLSADKIHAVLLQWKTLGFAPSKCGFGSMPLYMSLSKHAYSIHGVLCTEYCIEFVSCFFRSTCKPCDANGKSIKSIQDDEKVVFKNPLYEEFKTSQM